MQKTIFVCDHCNEPLEPFTPAHSERTSIRVYLSGKGGRGGLNGIKKKRDFCDEYCLRDYLNRKFPVIEKHEGVLN